MTREEQIKKQADIYTDDASNYAEWSDDGWSDTNDIELVEKAFIEGAKWADSTYVKGNIEKESELYAQGVVGDISEDIRHLLATAYIAGAKRIER